MHLIEFKICAIAGNGSRVVVTHQIFFYFKLSYNLIFIPFTHYWMHLNWEFINMSVGNFNLCCWGIRQKSPIYTITWHLPFDRIHLWQAYIITLIIINFQFKCIQQGIKEIIIKRKFKGKNNHKGDKLRTNKTNWYRLVSAQFPIIYLYTLFLNYFREHLKVKLMS